MATTNLSVETVGVTAAPALNAIELELVTEDSSIRFLLGPSQALELIVNMVMALDKVLYGDPEPVPPAGPLSPTF